MTILLDPRMVTPKHADALRAAFPQIAFLTDPETAADVDAIFCHPAFADAARLDRYASLTWVQFLMAGFDAADLEYLRRRGIAVTNLKDVFCISIAEDVFAKILYFNRGIRHDLQAMGDHRWEPVRHHPEIHGSTVGIIGAGSIGSAIATRMRAFGARVIGYRRKNANDGDFDLIVTGKEGLDRLLVESDYVIASLPLNAQTAGLIGNAEFARMKPDALFVNVGRGETVDQEALAMALAEGRIRGAGLDVTTPEPLPPDDPLWTAPNVFITPHNASSSPFIWPRIVAVLHENIRRRLAGEPLLHVVEE